MRRHHFHRRVRGFSLVELMVGIVVAMAAVVVVMQVFKVSEGQRRNTSGGDDAQTTGAIAVSLLQRDLRQAGQGFSNEQMLDCQLNLTSTRSIANLAPVIINPPGIPDGEDNTDVLLIGYGSGWGAPEGGLINSQPGAATYAVTAPQAYQLGDRVVAAPQSRASPCVLTLTSLAAAPTSTSVTVTQGMANASNGTLFNLGRAPRFVAYAVRSGQLTACDFMTQDCTSADPANWTDVAEGIVSLRAEYAQDTSTPRDAVADSYSQTVSTATPTYCGWSRIVGLRLVLVARSRQAEKEDVTASAPTWAGAASVSLTDPDWRRYRYRTFETTVPLRNTPAATAAAFTSCPP
ncbi:type IV pilus assembly protein PilW [Pelomonas saccharophila]|uniref:Type IV pilus assembly protein PilW n=1 Tax=Roseateles saccharophilus TaxID=304 RepID=A0ABU1YLD0_ROSSA|nr:PilW family protein [Roseateles saccharophilus]MDR7269015.1 type IV pilus assembly protein PilW [Roseateles saccharophilus]